MMRTTIRGLFLAGLAFGTSLGAAVPAGDLAWGVGCGLMAPLPSDLRVTTGAGPDLDLGLHADWQVRPGQAVRTVLDAGWYSGAERLHAEPTLAQALATRVSDEALGAEYLWRPARFGGDWELGAGLYLIRWRVASVNQLTTAGGTFTPSGTSTWIREGLGILAGRWWNPHLETVAKVQLSHYGYENQPTRVASLNVLWQF